MDYFKIIDKCRVKDEDTIEKFKIELDKWINSKVGVYEVRDYYQIQYAMKNKIVEKYSKDGCNVFRKALYQLEIENKNTI